MSKLRFHKFCVFICTLIAVCANTVGVQQSAIARTDGWTQIRFQPGMLRSQAMTYDSQRGVTILFGGADSIELGETWEWNGSVWTLRATTGPAPRSNHAMVFDAARGVTVLYGGRTFGGANAETWEWDGTTWTQRLVAGPPLRYEHAMCYDAARGVTVMFGGNNGTSRYDDIWEWDGTAWLQREATGPSARSSHAMSYDSVRHVSVLFGGATANSVYNGETWEWDGATWVQRAVTGPVPRLGHAMAFDSARGLTVLFGGLIAPNQSGYTNESWEWDGTAWIQQTSAGTGRYAHAMAFDSGRGKSVLYGGVTSPGPTSDETWELSGTTWTQIQLNPTKRGRHAMAYDSSRAVVVLFGGTSDSAASGANGETWEWNGQNWTFRQVSGPSARYGHSMAYDSDRHVTVLFGGITSAGLNDETWEWDGNAWNLRQVSGPSARNGHAMAYDALHQITLLSGGHSSTNRGTWQWNGTSWTQLSSNNDIGLNGAMTYDSLANRCLTYKQDTIWAWGGTFWYSVPAFAGPSPSGFIRYSLAFDSHHGQSILTFGSGASLSTYEWNGSAWTIVSGPRPPSRDYSATAFDAARGVTVMFGGGTGNNPLNDTWLFNAPCIAPTFVRQPTPRSICLHRATTFTVAAGGDAPQQYQWRRDGVAIDPTSNPSAATAALSITSARLTDDAMYDCIVTNACNSAISNAARLTICAGDYNCDAIVDFFDYLDFVSAFAASDPAADFNDDGIVDFFDYLDFVQSFSVGC